MRKERLRRARWQLSGKQGCAGNMKINVGEVDAKQERIQGRKIVEPCEGASRLPARATRTSDSKPEILTGLPSYVT